MLGECQSKCEHIAGVPLRPDTAARMQLLYLAKGVLATTAIEGNTLSEEEVVQHLEGQLELPPSREYLRQEIDNILVVSNEMVRVIRTGKEKLTLTADRIKYLNKTILKGLSLEEGIVPGEIRKHNVGVARYKAPPASACEELLTRLCDWIDSDEFRPPIPRLQIASAILKSIIAHLYLAWIHPFGDGNGRTARLVEVQILFSSGVPAPAAHLLSNHYNQTRTEYYRQLNEASRSGGDVIPFIRYAVQGLLDGLIEQLSLIREQHLGVAWINYVHERFRNKNSPANLRRRRLVLDLSAQEDPVPLKKLPIISRRIAEYYQDKTSRTISRDVSYLLKEELIRLDYGGYRANTEIILAFFPAAKDPEEEL